MSNDSNRTRALVLASASPRRHMLLFGLGFDLRVRPADVVEIQAPGEAARDMVERLARTKAWAIAEDRLPVLAADTAVVLRSRTGEEVLGKPQDRAEAERMLRRLSGQPHVVLTGYCVRLGSRERMGCVETQVWFRSLSEAELAAYLDTEESMDKAGAYGIQGYGGALVERIEGSYSNVVGLPVAEVICDIEALLDAQ